MGKSDHKVVVIYSGGMDSFTLVNDMMRTHKKEDIHALSFHYGQRHVKELACASQVCARLGITHKIVPVPSLLFEGSALTSDIPVPEGHYEDENMKQTYVPNRNMVMLSIAIAYAVSIGSKDVVYGAHSGDHAIYPDCRPDFLQAMNFASQKANYEPVRINAPYMYLNKADIVTIGLRLLGLNYADSWTCYNGLDKACGKCGSCQERLEAFAINNETDPLEYV